MRLFKLAIIFMFFYLIRKLVKMHQMIKTIQNEQKISRNENRNHPKNNGAKTIDADYKVLD